MTLGSWLDRVVLDVPCPRCGFYESLELQQIRLGDIVICGGCKANIVLSDLEGRLDELRHYLNSTVGRLREALGGGFTIKLGG